MFGPSSTGMPPSDLARGQASSPYRSPQRSSVRYRPSKRALRKSSHQNLRSPRHTPKHGRDRIVRSLEVRVDSASPPGGEVERLRPSKTASRQKKQRARKFRREMLNSRSLSTASTTTACELEKDDGGSDLAATNSNAAQKLPPFQQSKRWPGRRWKTAEDSTAKDGQNNTGHRPVDTKQASKPAQNAERSRADEGKPLPAPEDAASLALANTGCGLPTMAALSDLRNRHNIKTHIAVKRWLSKSGTIGPIRPVSSHGNEDMPKGEKRASLPRRMQSKLLLQGQKISSQTKRHIGDATRAALRSDEELNKNETRSPESQNLKNRLSQSLIPNGDTCEFEQEMNREYPKIKEKHFGGRPTTPVHGSPKSKSPDDQGAIPRKSIDIFGWQSNEQTTRAVSSNDTNTLQSKSSGMSLPPSTYQRTSLLQPPPRTSSLTKTHPAFLARSYHQKTSVHVPDGSPVSKDARSAFITSQGLRQKSGGPNLRSRKSSTASPTCAPPLRPAASTDTLSRIEAQAGGQRKMSAVQNQIHSDPVRPLAKGMPLGSPPERPLPDLPPEHELEPLNIGSRVASRSRHLSRPTERISNHIPTSTSVGSNLSVRAINNSDPFISATSQENSPQHDKDIAASQMLAPTSNALNFDPAFLSTDLFSQASIHSQNSSVSGNSLAHPTSSKESIGRSEQVRAIRKRDVGYMRYLRHHQCISEEDEGDSTDLADQFPAVPTSRPESRSRSHNQARQRSQSQSLRTYGQHAATTQILGQSKVAVVAETNPTTSSFRVGTMSPSPSVASLKQMSPPRTVEKLSSRQSPRSHHSISNSQHPSSIIPITQTPPSSASSGVSGRSEDADIEETSSLRQARAVQIPSLMAPALLTPTLPAAPIGPSHRTSQNSTLTIRPSTNSHSHQLSSSSSRLRTLAKYILPSDLPALITYVADYDTSLSTERARNAELRRQKAELERVLINIHRRNYQEVTEQERDMADGYERLGRTRLLGLNGDSGSGSVFDRTSAGGIGGVVHRELPVTESSRHSKDKELSEEKEEEGESRSASWKTDESLSIPLPSSHLSSLPPLPDHATSEVDEKERRMSRTQFDTRNMDDLLESISMGRGSGPGILTRMRSGLNLRRSEGALWMRAFADE